MTPKGKLLIIGGAEDIGDDEESLKKRQLNKEFGRSEILKNILSASKKKKIEIITTGSKFQDEMRKRYLRAFHRIDYPNPGFIPIKDKMEAQDPDYLQRIKDAGAIFFTGGDQFRLATILGGTPLMDLIKQRYLTDKNFLIAGTSAGAMVLSSVMITSGGTEEAMLGRDLKTTSGFGIVQDCIIDTHFIKRGRFGRLAHAVTLNPDQLGIGLGEDTALIISHGSEAECRGSGMVVIIDGKNIHQTNVSTVTEDDAVFVENFKVHILVKGCRFNIKTRHLANPAISSTKKKKRHNSQKVTA